MQMVDVSMLITTVRNEREVLAAALTEGDGHDAAEEHRHRQLQISEQHIVKLIQLLQTFLPRCPTRSQSLIRNLAAHTFNDIGSLFEVERHFDNLRPTA